MYVMYTGCYKPSDSSACGAKFYSRLDDESHGNDFYGDGDHKFDGLCHWLDLFGKWHRGRGRSR